MASLAAHQEYLRRLGEHGNPAGFLTQLATSAGERLIAADRTQLRPPDGVSAGRIGGRPFVSGRRAITAQRTQPRPPGGTCGAGLVRTGPEGAAG